MEYSQCSPSQQLQQQQQQQAAQLQRDDSGSFAGMDDGWFSKCRYCHSRSPVLFAGTAAQRNTIATDSFCHEISEARSNWPCLMVCAAVVHCRGCGCMTAHEQAIKGSDVPFCRRYAAHQSLLQQLFEVIAASAISGN
jgi:hypothetical protein